VCDLAAALLEVRIGWKPIAKDCERAAVADAGLEEKRTGARARVSGEVSSKKDSTAVATLLALTE
jgi:hypothetical protein